VFQPQSNKKKEERGKGKRRKKKEKEEKRRRERRRKEGKEIHFIIPNQHESLRVRNWRTAPFSVQCPATCLHKLHDKHRPDSR
jgi:hypothetical protein